MGKQKDYYLVECFVSTTIDYGFYSSPEKIVEDLCKNYKCKFYYNNYRWDCLENRFSTYLTNNKMIKIIPNIPIGKSILFSMIIDDKRYYNFKITKCKLNLLLYKECFS